MKFSALAVRYAQLTPKKIHVALPLLMMAILYWLSSLPGTPLPDQPAAYALFYWLTPTMQNTLHIPAFGALAWAWRWALRAWVRTSGIRVVGACLIACAYGFFDEWHQSFVPGRYSSLTDVLLDAFGAVLGVWLAGQAGRHLLLTSQPRNSATDQQI